MVRNTIGSRLLMRSEDVQPALAQAVLDTMSPPGRRDLARAVSGPSWVMFASALDKAVIANPDLERALEEVGARSARTALAIRDLPVPSVEEFVASLQTRVTENGGTIVRAFWWGFHIQLSHDELSTTDPVRGLVEMEPTPASPFLAGAAAFMASSVHILRNLDRDEGVYISMSWFAPFIFVPTAV